MRSSLEIVIVVSGMLLFGPTAVWVPFLGRLIDFWLDRPAHVRIPAGINTSLFRSNTAAAS